MFVSFFGLTANPNELAFDVESAGRHIFARGRHRFELRIADSTRGRRVFATVAAAAARAIALHEDRLMAEYGQRIMHALFKLVSLTFFSHSTWQNDQNSGQSTAKSMINETAVHFLPIKSRHSKR